MSLKQMNLRFEMLKRDVSPSIFVTKTRNEKYIDRFKVSKGQTTS